MVKQFSYINIGLSLSLGWYGTYLPRCENYVRLHHETFKYFNFYAGFTQFQKSISGLKLPILPVLSNWPGIHAPLGASWCDTIFTWAHQCAPSCIWIPDPNRFCLKKSVRILHEILNFFMWASFNFERAFLIKFEFIKQYRIIIPSTWPWSIWNMFRPEKNKL